MPSPWAVPPSISEVLSVTMRTVTASPAELLGRCRPCHAIAHPGFGEDVRGANGIVAQLVAQLLDVRAHDPGVTGVERPPHQSQQLFVAQDAPRQPWRAR